MEFALTEDQAAIAEATRAMLVESCDTASLRKMLARDDAIDDARWAIIKDMGLIGILAPESAGGLGLSFSDLAPIAESAGYVALPEPLIVQAGVAIPLLADLEDDRGWLNRAVAGEIVAVGHPFEPFVADADIAAVYLLADGDDIHLVGKEEVTITRRISLDPFRRLFEVTWVPHPSTKVGQGWEATGDRGAVLAAAQLVGLGQRCIDMAVAYAKDRQQFGKPIGSYQAIKHLVANAQVAVEFARPVMLAAAAELLRGNLAARARVAHAKIVAGDAADLAARNAVQVHGAMGMTWEVDVHFFLKRILALKGAWGDSAAHMRLVIDRMTALPTGTDRTFASEAG
jgi:alkylation response protein AidB-like acyl-CoA dehydrogenase